MTLTWLDSILLTVVRQVISKAICETPFLVSTQAADLKWVVSFEHVANNFARIKAKGITGVYAEALSMLV